MGPLTAEIRTPAPPVLQSKAPGGSEERLVSWRVSWMTPPLPPRLLQSCCWLGLGETHPRSEVAGGQTRKHVCCPKLSTKMAAVEEWAGRLRSTSAEGGRKEGVCERGRVT